MFTEDDSADVCLTKGGGSCQTPQTLQILADLNHFSSSNKPRSADSPALVIVHLWTSVLIGCSRLFVQPKTDVTFWKALIHGGDARKPSTSGSAKKASLFWNNVMLTVSFGQSVDCDTPPYLTPYLTAVSRFLLRRTQTHTHTKSSDALPAPSFLPLTDHPS